MTTPSGAATGERARTRPGLTIGHSFVTLAILLVLCAIFAVLTPVFLTQANLTNVLRQVTIVVIVAVAGTMVLISGGLDISVGGVLALTGVVFASLSVAGVPQLLAILVSVAVGAAVGLLNATLVVRMGITPIIVTLGSLYFARGLAFIMGDGRAVVSGLPQDFIVPARTFVGPVPTPVIVATVVVVAFWALLHRSLLGKYTYAIGGNRETAVLSGLAVGRVQGGLYVLSGMTAGIAGVILASRLGSGQPDAGVGFEFEVIVAIILGGTSLAGGQGTIVGTVLGALIVAVLGNGLNLLGVQAFYQYLVQGAALIVAVLLDQNLKRRAQAGGLRFGRPRAPTPSAGAPAAGS
jgi:ribose/xylose/arabinose/galactoside ABC-type transport system permease subunit